MVLKNKRLILLLSLLGIGVSAYLLYVKLAPEGYSCNFGQCDVVQKSKYSEIFGIPVAAFGLFYYIALVTLILAKIKKLLGFWIIWGFLFSFYLTAIELFVLKAICGWCMLSFAIIIVINLLTSFKET